MSFHLSVTVLTQTEDATTIPGLKFRNTSSLTIEEGEFPAPKALWRPFTVYCFLCTNPYGHWVQRFRRFG